jgi:hypothetical protein
VFEFANSAWGSADASVFGTETEGNTVV